MKVAKLPPPLQQNAILNVIFIIMIEIKYVGMKIYHFELGILIFLIQTLKVRLVMSYVYKIQI